MLYHRLYHVAVSAAALLVSTYASAQATEFAACPSPFYLSQGSADSIQLFSGNPDALGGVDFAEVNAPQTAKLDYNAIAFRESDRFMYGLRSISSSAVTGPDAHLIRIGANAEIEDLGAITGMPDAFYLAGDMSPAGEYYVLSGTARDTLVTLDLGAGPVSGAATTVSTVGLNDGAGSPLEINSGDIAFADGRLWGLHLAGSGDWYLAEINVTTGELILAPNPTGISNPFGALWGTPDAVYGNANDGAGFFYFDLSTGVATQIASSSGAARNDAARCVSNRPIFPTDVAITKDNGQSEYTPDQTVVYTIDVSNQGLFGAVGVQVDDPLPANVNSATWTCTSQSGNAACRTASGSGAISAIVDLPAGSSVRFELSFTLDPGFSGDLVNTVTATLPNNAGSPLQAQDSDTSNNSATDRDRSPAGPQAVPIPVWVIVMQGLLLLGFSTRKLPLGRFRGA